MTYSQKWIVATLCLVCLPLALYLILVLHTPTLRLIAALRPFSPPALYVQTDTRNSLAMLDSAAPAEAHFARTHNVRVFEVNLPSRETFAYNLTGTLDIVLNRSLIGNDRQEAVALAHELFHASHRYGWIDLILPEEPRDHLFTQQVARRLGVPTPQPLLDDCYIWSTPVSLIIGLTSALALWSTRPGKDDLRAAVFKSQKQDTTLCAR